MDIISRKDAIAKGLTYYFTGKACKRGHFDKRYVSSRDCAECNRIKLSNAFNSNKQVWNRRNSEWKAKNPEKVRSYSKDYYEKNGNVIRARMIDYRASNPEASKEWRERNPDYACIHRMENREIYATYSRNRRTLLVANGGTHTANDIAATYARQNGICVYCSTDISSGYHVDHIMPLALGGSNWPNNLQCLCPTCNTRKGAKHPDDWHTEIGYINQ